MARPQTKVNVNTRRSIVAQYKKGGPGNGFTAIAERLGLGIQVIRRVLVAEGVTIRGKGRPALVA